MRQTSTDATAAGAAFNTLTVTRLALESPPGSGFQGMKEKVFSWKEVIVLGISVVGAGLTMNQRTNERIDGLAKTVGEFRVEQAKTDGELRVAQAKTDGRVELISLKVDHLTDKVGHLTDKVDHLTDKVGHLTDKVDHLTDKVDHLTDKMGHITDMMQRALDSQNRRWFGIF